MVISDDECDNVQQSSNLSVVASWNLERIKAEPIEFDACHLSTDTPPVTPVDYESTPVLPEGIFFISVPIRNSFSVSYNCDGTVDRHGILISDALS